MKTTQINIQNTLSRANTITSKKKRKSQLILGPSLDREKRVLLGSTGLFVERVVSNDSIGTIINVLVDRVDTSTTGAEGDSDNDTNDDTNDSGGTEGSTDDETSVSGRRNTGLFFNETLVFGGVAVVEVAVIDTNDGGRLRGRVRIRGRGRGGHDSIVGVGAAVTRIRDAASEGNAGVHSAEIFVLADRDDGDATLSIGIGVGRFASLHLARISRGAARVHGGVDALRVSAGVGSAGNVITAVIGLADTSGGFAEVTAIASLARRGGGTGGSTVSGAHIARSNEAEITVGAVTCNRNTHAIDARGDGAVIGVVANDRALDTVAVEVALGHHAGVSRLSALIGFTGNRDAETSGVALTNQAVIGELRTSADEGVSGNTLADIGVNVALVPVAVTQVGIATVVDDAAARVGGITSVVLARSEERRITDDRGSRADRGASGFCASGVNVALIRGAREVRSNTGGIISADTRHARGRGTVRAGEAIRLLREARAIIRDDLTVVNVATHASLETAFGVRGARSIIVEGRAGFGPRVFALT